MKEEFENNEESYNSRMRRMRERVTEFLVKIRILDLTPVKRTEVYCESCERAEIRAASTLHLLEQGNNQYGLYFICSDQETGDPKVSATTIYSKEKAEDLLKAGAHLMPLTKPELKRLNPELADLEERNMLKPDNTAISRPVHNRIRREI